MKRLSSLSKKSEYKISKVEMLLHIFHPLAKGTLCHITTCNNAGNIKKKILSKMDSKDNPESSASFVFY